MEDKIYYKAIKTFNHNGIIHINKIIDEDTLIRVNYYNIYGKYIGDTLLYPSMLPEYFKKYNNNNIKI